MTFTTGAVTHFEINHAELDAMLYSPYGDVARDLLTRATRVMMAARRQIHSRTGELAQSLHMTLSPARGAGQMSVLIGSDDPVAMIVHGGARPHVIKPRSARVLVFYASGGQQVFAHSVQHPGTKPNRFLTDNLKYAVI